MDKVPNAWVKTRPRCLLRSANIFFCQRARWSHKFTREVRIFRLNLIFKFNTFSVVTLANPASAGVPLHARNGQAPRPHNVCLVGNALRCRCRWLYFYRSRSGNCEPSSVPPPAPPHHATTSLLLSIQVSRYLVVMTTVANSCLGTCLNRL